MFRDASNDESLLQALSAIALSDDDDEQEPTQAAAAAAAASSNPPPCQALFCAACIQTWRNKENTCPACRAVVPKHEWIVHADASHTISKAMPVVCVYRDAGCEWTSAHLLHENANASAQPLTSIEVHMRDVCRWKPSACRNAFAGCTFVGVQADVHADTECCWQSAPDEKQEQMRRDIAEDVPMSLDTLTNTFLPEARLVGGRSSGAGPMECYLKLRDEPLFPYEFYLSMCRVQSLSLDAKKNYWQVSVIQDNVDGEATKSWERLLTFMSEYMAASPEAFFPRTDVSFLRKEPIQDRAKLVRSLYDASATALGPGGMLHLRVPSSTQIFKGAERELLASQKGNLEDYQSLLEGASIDVACDLPRLVCHATEPRWWIGICTTQIFIAYS